MTMRKAAQRIPFKPSKTQALLLERCFGDRRFAYNQQVEAFNTYDKESNPKPSYPNVTDMKNTNEWLRDSPIPSNALSNAIMDFRKAQSAYFHKAQYGKNRPRFASKIDNVQSFRNSMPIRRLDGNRYPLSRKLGSVRIRKRDRLRYPVESLSSWTVKRENGKYYLVLLFNVDVQPKKPVEGKIGIDVGVKDFITLSTGEKINYPNRMKVLEEHVKREQRKRAMNRSILRDGWSGLVDKLTYKAEWYGRTLIRVDRFYPSSKLCHECGRKYKELRLSEREWVCEHCGRKHDRDVNAALNIRDEALRLNQPGQ